MTKSADFRIAVFPGDGIGDEITDPALRLIANAAARTGGFSITPLHCPAGAVHYRDHGVALPKASMDTARKADAILLAAMGLPSVRYDDGTEISPQLDLRCELGLYAGVRPIRAIPGVPVALADPRARKMDFVILRESTEGLFASRGRGEVVEEFAVVDRSGRLQIPREYIEELRIGTRARVEIEGDHVEIRRENPDEEDRRPWGRR